MKKVLIILAVLLVVFVFYSNSNIQVTDFESCAEIGNPVMESYPRQCAHEGVTYVEDISIKCTEKQRDAQVCTMEYAPVCAKVNIECITTPCDPIQETFGNACTACSNPLVESYVRGECF